MADCLTRGSIVKNILHLSWPVMLAMALHTGFNVVDTIFVGKISSLALASISITFPVVFLIIALAAGVGIGITSLVARLLGAKKKKEAENAAEHALILGLVMTAIFTVAGLTLSRPLFQLIGATDEMMPLVMEYVRIIFGGSFFMFMGFIANSILRGTGDMKTPMKVMILATVLNIVLDPLFIFGIWIFPRMGIGGSALATIISRGVGSIIIVSHLLNGRSVLNLNLRYFKFKWKIISDILHVGIPASLSQSIISLGMFFVTKIAAFFGPMVIAAYGIAGRLYTVALLPSMGIASAVITIVGFNVGAGKYRRAGKTAWIGALLAFIFMETIGIIFFSTSGFWIEIFNSNPEIISVGTSYLKIVPLFFGLAGIITVLSSAFQGAGKGRPSLVITLARLFVFEVPLAYLFAIVLGLGPVGIWWSIIISLVAVCLLSVFWFKSGSWKKGKPEYVPISN